MLAVLLWSSAAEGAGPTVGESLADLLHGPKFIHISAQEQNLEIPWVIPAHQSAAQTLLHLFYFVGPGTATGTELVVSLDGRDVGAVTENPEFPEGQAVIRLSKQAIAGGEHTISLRLMTKATSARNTSTWTQVDLYRSTLSYSVEYLPWRQVGFADIGNILRQSSQNDAQLLRVQLVGRMSPTLLSAAQQIVAGLALRTDTPLLVEAESGADKTKATGGEGLGTLPISVVVGTEKDLAAGNFDVGKSTRPELILQRLKDSGTGVQLIVTGQTPAELLQAAMAFANNPEAVPAGTVWQVPVQTSVASGPNSGTQLASVLRPGMEIPIDGRNLLTGREAATPAGQLVHFSFWMPGGQFANRQAKMTMKLNLDVVPAKVDEKRPLVTIRANGNWISRWRLGLGAGHYVTEVPFSTLEAGNNRITLEVTGGTVKLLAGSTLHLPKTHDYAMLPDLQLFARTGYPLIRTGTEKLAMTYLDPSAQELSAGLSLFARLAQASRSSIPGASALIGDTQSDSNEIILGTMSTLSKNVFINAPVQLTKNGMRWQLTTSNGAWSGMDGERPLAFLMESPNDLRKHTWRVVFAVRKDQDFSEAAWRLVKPSEWDTLEGNFSWLDNAGKYHSTLFGKQEIFGQKYSYWYYVYLFSVEPYWWILIVLLLVSGGTFAGWIIIRRKRRHWRMEELYER
ncbi:cellulose biosynthesis cyclic di-GMP-binding regulatory protein BcsB [Acidithiobacillus sp. AMEEHan]|uniref:cellulose biosynthesis cyclic di-GMP-binding regulatory protein BcsB n=1 Tax=Acidithiobacillus sp. AMEEHan TaxID=2994951 RepID=UPI0027E58465|nr:cellulose biosynthesis cyclic di-GMP-binding regulatory protein BcsB [Acidithiobacillus sp. AMEEHan]